MYEMMRNEILMSELTSSVSNSMNEYILTIFHTALIFSLFRFFCIKTKEMKDNNIHIQSDTVYISWNSVPNATGYKVYSSNNPYDSFLEDLSGTFIDTTWFSLISYIKKFYYVTTY